MPATIQQRISKSPYKNVYWFARYLLNTDQYGALGKLKEDALLQLVGQIDAMLQQDGLSDVEKVIVCKSKLQKELGLLAKPNTKTALFAKNLSDVLDQEITSVEDVAVFCITMKYIVAPTNRALKTIPKSDREFCHMTASDILNSLGEERVGLVIATWDDMGVKGCLDIERAAVVEEFIRLIDNLSTFDLIEHSTLDDYIILTAFIQEFERRAAQKRKERGGHSLETVASFLFDYYGFPSSGAPDHFDQDLEVDKWFKCRDGWTIGISCKRTLRERWKQLSQADRGTLSHFKIKELWHLITFDTDLSDDKIVRLGEQGQIFYLMDSSEIYKRCSEHIGMKSYVRPLSRLISDIRKNLS